jgi:hypothetical protein
MVVVEPKFLRIIEFIRRAQLKSYGDVYVFTYIKVKKGKAVPLPAWSGPECSRKLRFPDIMTTAQDSGKVVSFTRRPSLPPLNTHGTHFY